MKIFLTGNNGYVGKVMAKMLYEKNYEVIGCDSEIFPQEFIKSKDSCVKHIKKDIRDITKDDLKNCFAVIHLAGLSNDPLGAINPSLTNEINFLATIRLAKLAREVGVKRFIFSSSCSNYGYSEKFLDETSSLEPITEYAKSKVKSEQELLKLTNEHFSPVMLRNATVYGISPNQRLDLVVNNLVGSAVSKGKIQILSDGTAWRPLIHVEDMSNAFIKILEAKKQKIHGQVYNVGNTEENFRVKDIADMIQTIIPNSKIEFGNKKEKDARSYRVNFDKIKNDLEYKTKWSLEEGIKHIFKVFQEKRISQDDFNDKSFYRIKYLQWLIQTNKINSNLRFNN